MTPPNMMRPSNINRSKVPVPSYKAIQAANRAAAEQVDEKNSEKRGILHWYCHSSYIENFCRRKNP